MLPPGNDFDEGIARQAIGDALENLFKECDESDSCDKLDQLTSADISNVIESFVTGYIYRKWLQELGRCIERNALSEDDALHLEKEIHVFVKDAVHDAVKNIDPLTIDWNGNTGKQIINSIYHDAYSFIEGDEE